MKYFLNLLFFVAFTPNIFSQINNQTIFIKYAENTQNPWHHAQWITKDSVVHLPISPKAIYKEVFFVEDGKFVKTTDTIKHAKLFKEFQDRDSIESSKRQPISSRYHNSNILYRLQYDNNKIKYCVVDTLKTMTEWVLQADSLIILGYKCQKATTNFYGTVYTAYFTTELGFTGGPKNFRGLPGLILQVKSDKSGSGYTAIEIRYPSTLKAPVVEKDGKLMTINEYKAIIDRDNQLSIQRMGDFQKNNSGKKE